MTDHSVIVLVFGFLFVFCMIKAQDDQGVLLTVREGPADARLRAISGEPSPSNLQPVRGLLFPNDENLFFKSCDVDYSGKRIFIVDGYTQTILVGTHFNTTFDNPDFGFAFVHYGITPDSMVAYDWLADNLYWTDPVHKIIGIQSASNDDSYNFVYNIIVDDDLVSPTGITVDPLQRFLFWTDSGTSKIERSDLSGGLRKLLVTRSLFRPFGITSDITEERIYWTDSGRDTIESVTYDGEDRRMIRRIVGTRLNDIALYQNYLITTELDHRHIWYVDKDPAIAATPLTLGPFPFEKPYGVAVYHGDVQPDGSDYCSSSSCSHICVNDANSVTGYSCLCAQGYTLDSDNITCIEDNSKFHRNILLNNATTICSLDVRALSYQFYNPVCFYTHPNATASGQSEEMKFLEFDALRRNIYFATSTTVYKLNMDQAQLEAEQIITVTGTISGLSYDWIDYIIYVSDSVSGDIYAVSVDTLDVITLQSSLNNPFSVLVVPLERKYFWLSEATTTYMIESGDIGETDSSTTVVSDRLREPKDLAHDAIRNRIYWADSYNIWSCNYDGSDMTLFLALHFKPYLVTIYKDYLVWLSEYGGMSVEHLTDKSNINVRYFDDLGDVIDFTVIDEALQPRQKGPCDSVQSPCDQLCLSTKDGAVCHCEFGYQTTDNGQTCTSDSVAENFILVADWTHHRMYQLDLSTGNVNAVATFFTPLPTSLVYNPNTTKIVWSSFYTETIREVNLDGSEEAVLGSIGDVYVERIIIDSTSGNIFYAALHTESLYFPYDPYKSYIGVMSPDGRHRTIIDFLHFPGGIGIHAGDGLLFYTERGAPFRYIGRANMDGSDHIYLVILPDISDPLGLAIDYEARRLYWADRINHIIYSVNFDGDDQQTHIQDSGADLVDLQIDEHFIYFIGWNRPHVTRVSKTNSTDVVTLAPNAEFGRLEALFVYSEYYTPPPVNTDCQPNNGKGDCSTFCLPTSTGAVCACEDGYTLQTDNKTCDNGVDNCVGVDCQNGGSCQDGIDTFTCLCQAGYTGDLCATEINECDSTTCLNGGTCKDEVNSFSCQCPTGFTGTLCEQNIDDCEGISCLNGGSCEDKLNAFECHCVEGFTGTLCQTNKYDCIGVTCLNGGTCEDGVNSYSCKCLPGYTGTHCEANIDECIGITCENGGACYDGIDSYTCQCVAGYTGRHCEQDIDECLGVTCQNGGSCKDEINGFSCQCAVGYTGDLCEQNVNDCTDVTCYNGGSCRDGINTYTCQCVLGYTGLHCEQNIDDCVGVTCQYGGSCQDGINSYTCQCMAGLTGRHCEQNVDDCKDVTCQNGGSCQDELGSFTCQCLTGFTGTLCEQNINDCDGVTCQNGGSCHDDANSYTCQCVAGYTGSLCEQNIDDCEGVTCLNGGSCEDGVNSFTCRCDVGYTGTHCERNVDDCAGITCKNGGSCEDGVNFYSCQCLDGYSGPMCEINIDECAGVTCHNGGACVDGVNSYTCHCVAGYTGEHCEQNFHKCDGVMCQNDGTCEDEVNSFTCICKTGFAGTFCQQNIDDCAGVNCENGGTCEDGVSSFTCHCVTGFAGDFCQVVISSTTTTATTSTTAEAGISAPSTDIGPIIGGSIAAIALLALVAVAIIIIWRRRRAMPHHERINSKKELIASKKDAKVSRNPDPEKPKHNSSKESVVDLRSHAGSVVSSHKPKSSKSSVHSVRSHRPQAENEIAYLGMTNPVYDLYGDDISVSSKYPGSSVGAYLPSYHSSRPPSIAESYAPSYAGSHAPSYVGSYAPSMVSSGPYASIHSSQMTSPYRSSSKKHRDHSSKFRE